MGMFMFGFLAAVPSQTVIPHEFTDLHLLLCREESNDIKPCNEILISRGFFVFLQSKRILFATVPNFDSSVMLKQYEQSSASHRLPKGINSGPFYEQSCHQNSPCLTNVSSFLFSQIPRLCKRK